MELLILGIILAVIGALLGFPIILWIGVGLIIVGALFWISGQSGRPVMGRAYWY